MFSRSELRAMIISILVITLAFAFDDKSLVFQWSYWLSHLFSVFIMVAIALFAQQFGHKLVANLILMVIAAFFNSYGTFDTFILINGLLAFFYMLPLPRLPGIKIYFGSPLLYVSTLVFTVSMILLVYNVGAIPLLIISLLSLFVSGSLYYYYSYFR